MALTIRSVQATTRQLPDQHCFGMPQGTAMATASKLLLLLLCSYHSFIFHAGATGSVKHQAVCSEAKGIPSAGGATVQLHHRHGPCSPVPSKKVPPTLEELLRSDELRTSYIQRKFSGAGNSSGDVQPSEIVTVPTTLGSSLDTLEYVITVGLGTPAATQTMMIDTGSDVSWVQCTPCSKCHSQVDPLFDPSSSSSYSAFPCSSAACAQLGTEQSNGCTDSQCQYVVHYGDRSKTTGTYSSDTLTLGSDAIKGFQFGCSHAEAGFDDKTDGLMGLGGGAQSLVSQTAATLGEAFSYCLPPSTSSAAGFLTLGAASSTAAAGGFVTTGMHRSSQVPTYYMVRLEGIMVGGKKLSVAPSVFSGGSVMDSGTVVTRLPAAAYAALSSAFRAAMATKYRPAPPRSIFDTCFDLAGQNKPSNVTPVALVFDGGAVVNLDSDGIMMDNCLAFAATDGISIIGNVLQRTFEVLYDVGKSTLGFRAGAC